MQGQKASNATSVVQLGRVEIGDLARALAPKPSTNLASKSEPATESEGVDPEATSSRPAQRNVVLPCFSKAGRERIFSELNLFFEVHPSRFFVLDLRPETSNLSVLVGEPLGDYAGSQVVVFEGGPNNLAEIVGLLRAHVLIGVHTELALFDGTLLPEALSSLIPVCDSVLMESDLFDHIGGSGWGDGRAALFNQLLNAKLSIVDSGWLKLSSIREELRRAFDQRGFLTPKVIEIVYSSSLSSSALPITAVLLAGWCCARLNAHTISPRPSSTDATVSSYAIAEVDEVNKIALSFIKRDLKGVSRSTVSAEVTGLKIKWSNGEICISISQGKIETSVEAMGNGDSIKVHSERILESESDTDRWRRYFLIGESVTNYKNSLKLALPLFR